MRNAPHALASPKTADGKAGAARPATLPAQVPSLRKQIERLVTAFGPQYRAIRPVAR
jgi:hypothetical protein